MTEKRGIAYHEAGHAVVAWCFEMQVISVQISLDGSADGHWAGHTQCQPGSDNPLTLEELIETRQAGRAAERLFGYRAWKLAGVGDLGTIENLLADRCIPNHQRAPYFDAGLDAAFARLKDHQHRVIRLAERLFEITSLDGDEFLRLMYL